MQFNPTNGNGRANDGDNHLTNKKPLCTKYLKKLSDIVIKILKNTALHIVIYDCIFWVVVVNEMVFLKFVSSSVYILHLIFSLCVRKSLVHFLLLFHALYYIIFRMQFSKRVVVLYCWIKPRLKCKSHTDRYIYVKLCFVFLRDDTCHKSLFKFLCGNEFFSDFMLCRGKKCLFMFCQIGRLRR